MISLKIESDYFEVQIPSTINNRMVCTYLNSLNPRSDWNVEYNIIESDVSNDVNMNSLIDDGNDTHPIIQFNIGRIAISVLLQMRISSIHWLIVLIFIQTNIITMSILSITLCIRV